MGEHTDEYAPHEWRRIVNNEGQPTLTLICLTCRKTWATDQTLTAIGPCRRAHSEDLGTP